MARHNAEPSVAIDFDSVRAHGRYASQALERLAGHLYVIDQHEPSRRRRCAVGCKHLKGKPYCAAYAGAIWAMNWIMTERAIMGHPPKWTAP